MSFIKTLSEKYKIVAAPIDIETPRDAEAKEKKRKAELKKKADGMIKPYMVKLEKDFNEFAKKYVFQDGSHTFYDLVVVAAEHQLKLTADTKSCRANILGIQFGYKENEIKEPSLLWATTHYGDSLVNAGKVEWDNLTNYSQIEEYLNKALNHKSIVKKQAKLKVENDFAKEKEKLQPLLTETLKMVKGLATKKIKWSNAPTPSSLTFKDETEKNAFGQYAVMEDRHNILHVSIYLCSDSHESKVSFWSELKGLNLPPNRLVDKNSGSTIREVVERVNARLVNDLPSGMKKMPKA